MKNILKKKELSTLIKQQYIRFGSLCGNGMRNRYRYCIEQCNARYRGLCFALSIQTRSRVRIKVTADVSFQLCIFADGARNAAVRRDRTCCSCGTKDDIRRLVPAMTDVRWKFFHLLSSFFDDETSAACGLCFTRRAGARRGFAMVRRHFYYSAGRRFDAPRRLCKRDAAFAAFFLRMHARHELQSGEASI